MLVIFICSCSKILIFSQNKKRQLLEENRRHLSLL